MADFYFKVKTDKRYEDLAIYSRKISYSNGGIKGTYEEAVIWMETWINKNRGSYEGIQACSCCIMINHLNSCLIKMKKAKII